MADILVDNQGSLVILFGMNPEATEWLTENLDPNAMRWAGGFIVEPRYVGAILDGAADEGLEIQS